MQVKSIAECIISTFIKLPFVIKIFILPIFEWPFCTDFTVHRWSVDFYKFILEQKSMVHHRKYPLFDL